jgi:nucleolar GTP-binding protein
MRFYGVKNNIKRFKMNPFRDLMTVLTGEELLDFIFHRASKVKVKGVDRLRPIQKARKKEKFRIRTIEKNLLEKLDQYIKSYPNLELISPFYLELANIVVEGGVDRVREVLASISGILPVINKITAISLKKIRFSNNAKEIAKIRIAYYGRISSIIKKLSDRFDELIEFRKILRKLPSIDPYLPTLVVAGYPNVGKSSLVRTISTAQPEISYYPFTTKEIIVGKFTHQRLNIQIIDSPGLLDRPLDERNEIELQSIFALKYLAKLIIYMIDPSESCGYPIGKQINLLDYLQDIFPEIEFIIVINKIDLNEEYELDNKYREKIKIFRTNLLEESGIDDIKEYIIDKYSKIFGENSQLNHETFNIS